MDFVVDYWWAFLGVWVVYKYQVRIFTGGFGKGEKVGEFRTFEEARLKTYKQLHEEFPEKDIDILDMKDENGKYFLIEIAIGFAKWVFIPEEKH